MPCVTLVCNVSEAAAYGRQPGEMLFGSAATGLPSKASKQDHRGIPYEPRGLEYDREDNGRVDEGIWGTVERKSYVRTGFSLSVLAEAGSRRVGAHRGRRCPAG